MSTKCLVKGCKFSGDFCRGMCRRCYSGASRLVRKNETTWDELVAKGIAAESRRISGESIVARALAESAPSKKR